MYVLYFEEGCLFNNKRNEQYKIKCIKSWLFIPWRSDSIPGHGLPLGIFATKLKTHHTRWDSSGRVTSPMDRPLPDNTQHSQQTDIHSLPPDGIRTRNPSKRAAEDPRLRSRGHWDRLKSCYLEVIFGFIELVSPLLTLALDWLCVAERRRTGSVHVTISSYKHLYYQ